MLLLMLLLLFFPSQQSSNAFALEVSQWYSWASCMCRMAWEYFFPRVEKGCLFISTWMTVSELGLFKGSIKTKSSPLLCAIPLWLIECFIFSNYLPLITVVLVKKGTDSISGCFRVTWAGRMDEATSLHWNGVDICTHTCTWAETLGNWGLGILWSGSPAEQWVFLGGG